MTPDLDAGPRTVADYLAVRGIEPVPVAVGAVGIPTAELLVPPGWRELDDELVPHAYRVWALPPTRGAAWADNAVVLLGWLPASVDSAALLHHAFADSRRMPHWREEGAHHSLYGGYPAAAIAGHYVVGPLRFWSSTRYLVISSGGDQFLLQATITVRAAVARDGRAIADSLAVTEPEVAQPVGPAMCSESSVSRVTSDAENRRSTAYAPYHRPLELITDLEGEWDEDDEYYARKRRTGWLE